MSEVSVGGASSTQAGRTTTPVGKDVTPMTDETDEMDEISSYGKAAVTGVNPREIKSINGRELVTVQKSPANMGNLMRAE